MNKSGWYIILMLLVVSTLLMAGCSYEETQNQPGSPAPAASPTSVPTDQLKILGDSMTKNQSGDLIVLVRARNTGKTNLAFAEIQVRLFDKDGGLVKTSLESTFEIEPDGVWEFEVMFSGAYTDDVKTYETEVGVLY